MPAPALQALYIMSQPMAKHQLREVIWKKESEITMVEALVKLGHVHDVITASLEGHAVNSNPHAAATSQAHVLASSNAGTHSEPGNMARVHSVSSPGRQQQHIQQQHALGPGGMSLAQAQAGQHALHQQLALQQQQHAAALMAHAQMHAAAMQDGTAGVPPYMYLQQVQMQQQAQMGMQGMSAAYAGGIGGQNMHVGHLPQQ